MSLVECCPHAINLRATSEIGRDHAIASYVAFADMPLQSESVAPMDLVTLTRHYAINHRKRSKDELEWFRTQSSLENTTKVAALAIDVKGKRLSHQRRIRRENLEKARVVLLSAANDIQQCKTFDELLSLIESELHEIQGLAELYAYDTALRIGAKLGLVPEKVYLHAGTRKGAEALGLDSKARALEVSALPNELQELEPREMEDFLCIYKDELRNLKRER